MVKTLSPAAMGPGAFFLNSDKASKLFDAGGSSKNIRLDGSNALAILDPVP